MTWIIRYKLVAFNTNNTITHKNKHDSRSRKYTSSGKWTTNFFICSTRIMLWIMCLIACNTCTVFINCSCVLFFLLLTYIIYGTIRSINFIFGDIINNVWKMFCQMWPIVFILDSIEFYWDFRFLNKFDELF